MCGCLVLLPHSVSLPLTSTQVPLPLHAKRWSETRFEPLVRWPGCFQSSGKGCMLMWLLCDRGGLDWIWCLLLRIATPDTPYKLRCDPRKLFPFKAQWKFFFPFIFKRGKTSLPPSRGLLMEVQFTKAAAEFICPFFVVLFLNHMPDIFRVHVLFPPWTMFRLQCSKHNAPLETAAKARHAQRSPEKRDFPGEVPFDLVAAQISGPQREGWVGFLGLSHSLVLYCISAVLC